MSPFIHRGLSAILALALSFPIFAAAEKSEIMLDGKRYILNQDFNRFGAVVRQSVVSSDWQELSLDDNGDGIIDRWESTKGFFKISAHSPYDGQYMFVEIEQRRPKHIEYYKYIYSRGQDVYKLFSARKKPYSVLHKSDVVIGMCSADATRLKDIQKVWQAILKSIAKGDYESGKEQLLEYMLLHKDKFVDQSCSEGKFAGSIDAILEGIADVALSEMAAVARPDQQPKYLACLNALDLPIHAMRIDAQFNRWKTLIDAGAVDKGAEAKPVSCEYSTRWGASWVAQQSRTQVILHTPISEISGGLKPSEVYASEYFHEMVHASGVEDEEDTISLQECCSNGYGSDQSRCQPALAFVERYRERDAYSAALGVTLGDPYTKWKSEVDNTLGELSDQMVNQLSESIAKADKDAQKGLTACATQAAGNREKAQKCVFKYEAEMALKTREFFNSSCPAYAVLAGKESSACDKLANSFYLMTDAKAKELEAQQAADRAAWEAARQASAVSSQVQTPTGGTKPADSKPQDATSPGSEPQNPVASDSAQKPSPAAVSAEPPVSPSLYQTISGNAKTVASSGGVIKAPSEAAQHVTSDYQHYANQADKAKDVVPARPQTVNGSQMRMRAFAGNRAPAEAVSSGRNRSSFVFDGIVKALGVSTANAAESKLVKTSNVSAAYKANAFNPGKDRVPEVRVAFHNPFQRDKDPGANSKLGAPVLGDQGKGSVAIKSYAGPGATVKGAPGAGANYSNPGAGAARERPASGVGERAPTNAGPSRQSGASAAIAASRLKEKGREFDSVDKLFEFLRKPYESVVRPRLKSDMNLREKLIDYKVQVDDHVDRPYGHRQPRYLFVLEPGQKVLKLIRKKDEL